MRIFLGIFILLLFIPGLVFGEPFMTCEPQAGVTHYRVEIPSMGIDEVNEARSDGSAWHDVGNWSAGTYVDGKIYAGSAYILDGIIQEGIKWSSPLDFTIGIPSVPGMPGNGAIRLP